MTIRNATTAAAAAAAAAVWTHIQKEWKIYTTKRTNLLDKLNMCIRKLAAMTLESEWENINEWDCNYEPALHRNT